MNIAAIVPMRHHSKRVPGKNYRKFLNNPLYYYILCTLKQCSTIGTIYVDTDSPVIRMGVKKSFPDIVILDRPEQLRGDEVPMNEILFHALRWIEAEIIVQTHCTNPLLKARTIDEAVEKYLRIYPTYDSLFGVTKIQLRLWNAHGRPINHDPKQLLPTQKLEPIYVENSCLYIFHRDVMLKYRNRIGVKPYMYVMDPVESWDIDEEWQFKVGEMIYFKLYMKGNKC